MKSKRRSFTAEFKAQVAIEALKGQETLAQLSERFNVSSVMISNWKSDYPAPRLSTLGSATYVHPYLLRKMKIDHPNQVWSTDISYIPMGKGFHYL